MSVSVKNAGGGEIDIKNGTVLEKYAASESVPANMFFQNCVQGINVVKDAVKVNILESDETASNLTVLNLHNNLCITAYVEYADTSNRHVYLRVTEFDENTGALTAGARYDLGYPDIAYSSKINLMKLSSTEFLLTYNQYAYKFTLTNSKVLTKNFQKRLISNGTIRDASLLLGYSIPKLAILYRYSSGSFRYVVPTMYSVTSSDLIDEVSLTVSIFAEVQSNEERSRITWISPVMMTIAYTKGTTKYNLLNAISVDLSNNSMELVTTSALSMTGFINKVEPVDTNRFIVTEYNPESPYQGYVKLYVALSSSISELSRYMMNNYTGATSVWSVYYKERSEDYVFALSDTISGYSNIILRIASDKLELVSQSDFKLEGSKFSGILSPIFGKYTFIGFRAGSKSSAVFYMAMREGIVKSYGKANGVTKTEATTETQGKVIVV